MLVFNYVYNKLTTNNNKTIVGKLQNNITIYAHKNDKDTWERCPTKLEKFMETPVLYSIEGQSSSSFIINTPTKSFPCVFDNNVDVKNNHCIVRRSQTFTTTDFKATLNHPTEIVLELLINQMVTVNGYLDVNDTFHINSISNYDIVF